MKQRTIAFVLFACILVGLSSCRSSESSISYKEAFRYFVRNDVTDYSSRLIQSSEELNRYFGTATTMGKNGMPTNIDFTKYNVVAIICTETNIDTEIKVSSIKKQGDKIIVKYRIVQNGNPMSYSTVPCLMLQIDKKYGSNAVFVKE